jgi:hypothetical protein
MDVPEGTEVTEPGRTPSREDYFREIIKDAARRLREANVAHLVATDLEDALAWSVDPTKCAHPYWNCRADGSTVCRSCGTDTTEMEAMGR